MDSAVAICKQQKELEEETARKKPDKMALSEELLDMPSDDEMETSKHPSTDSTKGATLAKGQGDGNPSSAAATCSARPASMPRGIVRILPLTNFDLRTG